MTDDHQGADLPFCDIVMKGGITSGVVYPLAIVELHKKYRIKSVGGTSAGALAAVLVAAAEYARASGGYDRIADLPDEISDILLSLFQPEPKFRPLYDAFVETLEAEKPWSKIFVLTKTLLRGYPAAWLPWTLPGVLLVVLGIFMSSVWLGLFGLLIGVIGPVIGLLRKLLRLVTRELPASDFGICSGSSEDGYRLPALTDWLTDKVDEVAGLELNGGGEYGRPLTFGDLKRDDLQKNDRPKDRVLPPGHSIDLATMTTDLMMRRPYRLPFQDKTHFFSEAEFRKLFPDRVVDQMIDGQERRNGGEGAPTDLYRMPRLDRLPIVVAARMSLSFPGLIRAVRVWKRDFTRTAADDIERMIPCLFTDGGLSSNFPIHFFDSLLPSRPTFAIALEGFHPERHIRERGNEKYERRVWMDKDAGAGQILPLHEFSSIGGFLMTLLHAAKDWQDNLQSTLPGYRERIAHIALKEDEGGLNLTMPKPTVRKLVDLGKEASKLLTGDPKKDGFDFDDHRWRRLLVVMSKLEEELVKFADAWHGTDPSVEPYHKLLFRLKTPSSYDQPRYCRAEMLRRARALASLGRKWRENRLVKEGASIPRPVPNLRLTPKE